MPAVHSKEAPDIEIRIPNPFKEDWDWVVPVQVKDHEGEVPEGVTNPARNSLQFA